MKTTLYHKGLRAALAGAVFAWTPVPGFAQSEPMAFVPVPKPRPQAAIEGNLDRVIQTGAVPPRIGALSGSTVTGGSVAQLKSGLDALSSGNLDRARKIRDGLPANALDRHILAWAIAMQGDSVPSGEIAAAAQMLAGWPGLGTLRRNSEKALFRENPAPGAVLAAFGDSKPQTVEGAIVLARALVASGQRERARAALAPFWRKEKLDAKEEVAILKEFGSVLSKADHRFRMERMLYSDRISSAQRVAGLAGAKQLADAWAAVVRNEKSARKLLDAVPAAQRSAGYLFAEARYLRRQERFTQAAGVMAKAPKDQSALVDPDAWWIERRVLSRELLDVGKAKLAYQVAAGHAAEKPVHKVDAEFHAGWYALRALNDPATAHRHFARIVEVADGPISLSRGFYWLGRSAAAGAPGDSASYFQRAARYGSTFYGQLSAARLGSATLNVAYPSPADADRKNFATREAVKAIRRLEEAGYPSRANLLYRDLAEQLTSPGELALLAVMAEKRGDHSLALKVGKIAARRGIDVGALSHPVGVIPATAKIGGAGAALAYAVARQESEFNIGAVSSAGARGLLQLLPGTAKEMARKAGMSYSPARLTSDPGYNAALGATFLGEQLGRFDGSYVLTFAGYNAGPRRAREWVERYGDPRGKDIETVVDWIERIPFSETRSYVQRVMENYQVYKMRLSGRANIVEDLVNGR